MLNMSGRGRTVSAVVILASAGFLLASTVAVYVDDGRVSPRRRVPKVHRGRRHFGPITGGTAPAFSIGPGTVPH